MISKIILGIIKRYRLHDVISSLQDQEKIRKCAAGVSTNGGVFYPEATVDNLKGDPNAISIGANTHIRGKLLVWRHGGLIRIGSYCFVGPDTRIWSGSKEGIQIGNNVLISHGVNIIDSDSHEMDHLERAAGFRSLIERGHPEKNERVNTQPIVIHDHAWISYGVSILKGVTIGTGAIIGAGAVVTRDVPSFTLVAGNPAIEIKKI